MIPGFEALVEQRIKKAQKDGEFDNLEAAGKPFTLESEHVPEELRLAHKILKNAGFLPPEVELKKKITRTEQLIETAIADSPQALKLNKKLNYLLTKLNTIRGDRPCLPMVPDNYRDTLIKKIT